VNITIVRTSFKDKFDRSGVVQVIVVFKISYIVVFTIIIYQLKRENGYAYQEMNVYVDYVMLIN